MHSLLVLLNSSQKKKSFSCGKEMLDNYLRNQAKQDVKRKLSACFILADENNNIRGYYTLSNAAIPRDLLPEDLRKKLPASYQDLPATLLGRLAIDRTCQGQRLGQHLLMDALKRSFEVSEKIGSMAVIVDPIDEAATKFYQKFGFIPLPDSGKMFLSMATLSELF